MEVFCSLEPEVRCGYFVSEKMKKVWNIQLNMLVRLIEVCKKYNLKVTLDSGSLLGAIRHKGFIPWDDDIDVDMPREDYDKLIEIASKEFKTPFHFQSAYTERGYYRGHAQIRYDDTTMILPEEVEVGINFHQGIFIDIFPSDGVPDDNNEKRRLASEVTCIYQYLWMRHYPLQRYTNFFSFLSCCKSIGDKAKWDDIELYRYTEQLFRQNPFHTSKEVFHYSLILNRPTRSLKLPEWYDEVIYVPFENIMAPIPQKYHEILSQVYGDYMKPSQAPSMHGTVIIDTEKSYIEYLSKLRMPQWKIAFYFVRSITASIAHILGYKRK